MIRILVVVNPQNDFISGPLSHLWEKTIASKIAKEIENGDYEYVVAVRDTHYHDYFEETLEGQNLPIAHCIYDTWGWQIEDGIEAALQARSVGAHRINTPTFGALNLAPDIFDFLGCRYGVEVDQREVEITICGFNVESAVVSNALLLRAYFPNSQINCIADLCAGCGIADRQNAFNTMENCYIEIK